MRKVRLADIAEKVGVSTVTVHNALMGHKGVSESMRTQIQETAREMGYEPVAANKGKKAAEQGEFRKIGVLIAENYLAEYATYYWKMYQELSLIATERRCYTTIEVLKKNAEKRTLEMPVIVKEHGIDGLIIIGYIDKKYIRALKAYTDIPIVFLDFYDNEIAKDSVIADNFQGMYQMTELLFEQGIEKIGFIGSIYATSSIMDRYCGFMKSMLEHHKTVPAEWVVEDRDEWGQIGFELPKCLPEAFVCNCDVVAGLLVNKLAEKGIRVPEDISVVGFDNFLAAGIGFTDLKITTYEVNSKAMSKVAVDKLLKQLKNPLKGRNLEIVSGQVVWKNSVKVKADRE
ncbi:LacI family DNA-binding transcriptional regulator [Roseburia hominis]